MAKCKVCGSEFQGESEYCENCFKEKKDFSSESYLDGLLKGMVNQPNTNQHINIKKKASIKNDTANDKVEIENNAEQEENNLENIKHTSEEKEQLNNDVEDILALIEEEQDILALEEDGDINEAVNAEGDSNSEILSLHNNFDEDMNEEENTPDYQESSNKEDNNSSPVADFDTMNEADDDLVALLGMITGLEESVNENREDIFALEENEDNWNQESLKNTSVAEEKSSESKGSQKEMGSIEVQEQETGSIKSNNDLLKDILSVDNIDENTIQPDPDKNPGDLGEIFSDSLSAIYSLNDQDLNVENITLDQPENREEVKKKKWERYLVLKKQRKVQKKGKSQRKRKKLRKVRKRKRINQKLRQLQPVKIILIRKMDKILKKLQKRKN